MKILLHYPVLNAGGAERSTLRLLTALVDRGCEVHLVLTVAGGRLEHEIDPRVVVHHLRDTVGAFPAQGSGSMQPSPDCTVCRQPSFATTSVQHADW